MGANANALNFVFVLIKNFRPKKQKNPNQKKTQKKKKLAPSPLYHYYLFIHSFIYSFIHFFFRKETPLHRACQRGQLDVIKFLVKNGASTNARNNEGKRPIDLARHVDTKSYLQSLEPSMLDDDDDDDDADADADE